MIDVKTAAELRQWYWLKQELVDYCKLLKISYTGSKAEITDRIAEMLETGIVPTISTTKKQKPTSRFNWAKEPLTTETIITDSYTNGPNTRRFFQKEIGPKFKFNIDFMAWMRDNCGKTLRDAIDQWHILEERKKDTNYQSTIPTSNQYNQYVRDFFTDNPDKTIKDARHFWLLKRSLPGSNKYEPSDLQLKSE
ncbi:MAG: DUF6434 domain-containing protein [Bacteroidota bacterium]